MNARLMHSPIAFNGNQTILSSLSFFNIKKDLQFLHRNFSYRIATNVSKTSLQNSLKLRQVPSICVLKFLIFALSELCNIVISETNIPCFHIPLHTKQDRYVSSTREEIHSDLKLAVSVKCRGLFVTENETTRKQDS